MNIQLSLKNSELDFILSILESAEDTSFFSFYIFLCLLIWQSIRYDVDNSILTSEHNFGSVMHITTYQQQNEISLVPYPEIFGIADINFFREILAVKDYFDQLFIFTIADYSSSNGDS
ncbi:MAG: hypothetical protein QNJ63_28985 [Calothrix sp. MO_192.B10]|nr:hypothetical protein [Calothrix sp. MO_192.B10]